MPARLPARARWLTLLVVLTNLLGNMALSAGLRGQSVGLRMFLSPMVLLGVTLLIVWLLSRMALLSWADLSYVLPVTSIGYVLSALVAWLFLGETVTPARWAGTALITSGMLLVSFTAPKTRAS